MGAADWWWPCRSRGHRLVIQLFQRFPENVTEKGGKKEGRTMKELIFVLVAFWNTPATLDNGKCSACGRWHVTSTVVMAAISCCTAMYCGSGYYDDQGAFHALRPATRARSTGNAAVDTGLSYRASNELFQRFPENVTEKGGNGRPAHRNTAAAGGVHCGERGEFGARYPHAKSVSSLRYWT
jgi:hypothetical protein